MVTHNTIADGRRLYQFDAVNVITERKVTKNGVTSFEPCGAYNVSAGWGMALYATDKRDAIKRFVALTKPTIRFECTDLTEKLHEAA